MIFKYLKITKIPLISFIIKIINNVNIYLINNYSYIILIYIYSSFGNYKYYNKIQMILKILIYFKKPKS